MVSIECIERGLARYLDTDVIPGLMQGNSAKGFALSVAASLLVKRGGNLLRTYAKAEILNQLGLVSADGAVDLDAIRDEAKAYMPQTGIEVPLPMGLSMRVKASDVDKLYEAIKKEATL